MPLHTTHASAAPPPSAPAGLRQLVTLASGFGSSFTLPVVFFSSMLPPAAAERALGYTALILLAWSPLLWSIGPNIVQRAGVSGGASAASADGGKLSDAARLWAFVCKVATPPFLAVMAGAVAGMTPFGRVLVAPSGGAAAAMLGPLGAGVLRNVMDVVKMLAGGALAGQSVVLAASLLQQSEAGSDAAAAAAVPQHGGGAWGAAKRLLAPGSVAEARVLATVSLTRFLLLPLLTLSGVWALQRAALLPAAVAADPVLLLVLLSSSVMPTAQARWGRAGRQGRASLMAAAQAHAAHLPAHSSPDLPCTRRT